MGRPRWTDTKSEGRYLNRMLRKLEDRIKSEDQDNVLSAQQLADILRSYSIIAEKKTNLAKASEIEDRIKELERTVSSNKEEAKH